MKIKILSGDIIDQIAAGEVVERPAHMIKEIVENSLDAGASRVEIEYAQGGRWVRVKDNGNGIAPEELRLALARHATSKISASEDLWNLHSFGFRGEALASISAVCRLTLTSRRLTDSIAHKVVSEFGQISELEEVGGEVGTQIQIEELFANTPARLKFLKSDAAEGVQIKNVIKAMALSHPEVEFHLSYGGKLIFYWPKAKSRLERAKQVLEIESLYEGEEIRESMRAYAVFSDPNTTAKTSKNIWLFAQKRFIQDRSLQTAVNEAYRNLLMHGEFPNAVVWLETQPDQVDVNIHPTKSQVKLQDPQTAFRVVRNSIRETLGKAPWLSRVLQHSSHYESFRHSENVGPLLESTDTAKGSSETFSFSDPSFEKTYFKKSQLQESTRDGVGPTLEQKISSDFTARTPSISAEGSTQSQAPSAPAVQKGEAQSRWADLDVLGQANLTYIITQRRDALVLVDMHAAHERVKFETLMEAWRGAKIEVQDYLIPLSFDFSEDKIEALTRIAPELEKLGIYIEILGPVTIGVKAAPLILSAKAIGVELERLAHELVEYGEGFSLERKIGDICATMACHSAVRAGQSLSLEQMRALLEEMDRFPLSSFCPHGRPVYVEYPFYKLEKDFGRIV